MTQEPPTRRPLEARTRLLSRAERRASLLEGATRAFAKGGFTDTSMEEIAASCGVTAAIVYRHFASKEDLYRAVLESIAESLGDCLPQPGAPFGIDLEALLDGARRDPEGFELFWRHAAREPRFSAEANALRERAVAGVREALRGAVDARLRDWAAHAAVGFAVEGVLNWIRYGDPRDDERLLRATRRALGAGVRAWPRDQEGRD